MYVVLKPARTLKIIWQFFKKLAFPCDSAAVLLGINSERNETCVHLEACPWTSAAALPVPQREAAAVPQSGAHTRVGRRGSAPAVEDQAIGWSTEKRHKGKPGKYVVNWKKLVTTDCVLYGAIVWNVQKRWIHRKQTADEWWRMGGKEAGEWMQWALSFFLRETTRL